MNHPAVSKINYTALAVLAIGIANTSGLIPPEYKDHAIEAATLIAPVALIVFRTWYTGREA